LAAATLREYFWDERDFSLRYSAIRAYVPRYGVSDDWGPPASLLFKTGRSQVINMGADVGQQTRWLEQFDPHVLIVYPSLLDGILQHCRKHGTRLPSLRFVRSVGETLADRLRAETRSLFSARVVDNYSSQFIQDARESIEVRLVTEAPLTTEQEDALRVIMRGALGFPFTLRFSYFPGRLPGSGGKFEEFVCRVGRAKA